MIHVLHVLPRMPIGGVGSFLINAQNSINKNHFTFDYLVIEDVQGSLFEKTVMEMGSKIYLLNDKLSLLNSIRIKRDINKFFEEHAEKYDILHLHSANIGMMVLPSAKKKGIKVRVLHAHSTKYSDGWIKSARNWVIETPILKYTTNLIACGKSAGDFQFKKRNYDIIYNGISTDKYHYKYYERNNRFIIGHVGNFVPVKNHDFLISLLEVLIKFDFDCEMWFAGTGPLENNIYDKVKQRHLENRVKFLGRVEHTEEFYNQIDLFVLPSFYEGFPVALMEAQACGTPVICSETITREVDFFKDCKFLSIDLADIDIWVKTIINMEKINREEKSNAFQKSQFTIKNTILHLEELYAGYIG
jgi:glycosyltransferase involved in cell wall biosynthesis